MLQLLLSERSAVTIQVVAGRKLAVPGAGTPVRTDLRPGHPPGGPTPAEGHARSISSHAGGWIPADQKRCACPKTDGPRHPLEYRKPGPTLLAIRHPCTTSNTNRCARRTHMMTCKNAKCMSNRDIRHDSHRATTY